MNFFREVWTGFRPYLVRFTTDFLISASIWVLLFTFKLLTKEMPITGWAATLIVNLHSAGVVAAMAILVILFVNDTIQIRRGGADVSRLAKPADFFRELSQSARLKFVLTWLTFAALVVPTALLISLGFPERYALALMLAALLPFQYASFCVLQIRARTRNASRTGVEVLLAQQIQRHKQAALEKALAEGYRANADFDRQMAQEFAHVDAQNI